jgi:hypothetical protein
MFNPDSALKSMGTGVKLGTHPIRKLEIHEMSQIEHFSFIQNSQLSVTAVKKNPNFRG